MKWLKLPTPVELGWSEHNALGSRHFSQPGQKTWEGWREKMRQDHPVKYFLNETLMDFFRYTCWLPISNAGYWLKYRFHPKHKHHLIDLRTARTDYGYGYIDARHALLLASFAILIKYIEKEEPRLAKRDFIEDSEYTKDQLAKEKEAVALYDYWTIERPVIVSRLETVLMDDDSPPGKYFEEEQNLEKRDNEMLHRLIEVRTGLWT